MNLFDGRLNHDCSRCKGIQRDNFFAAVRFNTACIAACAIFVFINHIGAAADLNDTAAVTQQCPICGGQNGEHNVGCDDNQIGLL